MTHQAMPIGPPLCFCFPAEPAKASFLLVSIRHGQLGCRSFRLLTRTGCPAAGGFKAKFHVGDTPMDVLAADSGDATAVGVLTGIYTQDELEKTGVGEQVPLVLP